MDRKEYDRQRYLKMRENPRLVEEMRRKNRAYYAQNKERINQKRDPEISRRYKRNHRELCRQRSEIYRLAHKKGIAARMREYRKKNPDKFKKYERSRRRSDSQRARFNKYRRRWAKTNLNKTQEYYQRRRAILSKNNTLTAKEIKQQREMQNGLCFYCKLPLDNNGNGHVDHKIPLIRGGENCKENIVIACSKCNLKKGRLTYVEFNSLRGGSRDI
jgi:5-methylcytosine-specific restriction endonuclease McrA